MKKQIEHFLLGLLWLLAVILGVSFWFNTNFGFNILSGTHWKYLGDLQAGGANIRTGFYISIIVATLVMVCGLYLLVRPKFRKINLGAMARNKKNTVVIKDTTPVINNTPPINTGPVRPPRLNLNKPVTIPTDTLAMSESVPMPGPITPTPTSTQIINTLVQDIQDIFTDAGYTVKKPPRIGTFTPDLFAIGPDEVLWLGTMGNPMELGDAIEKMGQIFTETLEDIKITIHGFALGKNPGATNPDIKTFDNMESLREYISNNHTRDLHDSEREDFDAYSEYVDTVCEYFNKA